MIGGKYMGVHKIIRKLHRNDINEIASIWLESNKQAHSFIPAQYWYNHLELTKRELEKAEVYIYEEDGKIRGFIGLSDDYIAGIFIDCQVQSKGIGRILLNDIKNKKERLYLNVYQKNVRAVKFYLREGFEIQSEKIDEETNEKEYLMIWIKQ